MLNFKYLGAFIIVLSWPVLAIYDYEYIKLLPNGNEENAIEVAIYVAKNSNTLKNMLEETGKKGEGIPIYGFEARILQAEVEGLNYIDIGKDITPKSLKKMIPKFFKRDSASIDDYLSFLLCVNYLDIPALIKPAVAVWVDNIPGYIERKEEEIKSCKQEDIRKLSESYIKWLKGPSELKYLELEEELQSMLSIDDKIYIITFLSNDEFYLIVIDTKENKLIKKVLLGEVKLTKTPGNGPKLYLPFYKRIAVLDVKSNNVERTISIPWLSLLKEKIIQYDDKSFFADGGDLLVANTKYDELQKENVKKIISCSNISSLVAIQNRLYGICDEGDQNKNKIFVIDMKDEKVLSQFDVPNAVELAITRDKLFVMVESQGLMAFDIVNGDIKHDAEIVLKYYIDRMIISGDNVHLFQTSTSDLKNNYVWMLNSDGKEESILRFNNERKTFWVLFIILNDKVFMGSLGKKYLGILDLKNLPFLGL